MRRRLLYLLLVGLFLIFIYPFSVLALAKEDGCNDFTLYNNKPAIQRDIPAQDVKVVSEQHNLRVINPKIYINKVNTWNELYNYILLIGHIRTKSGAIYSPRLRINFLRELNANSLISDEEFNLRIENIALLSDEIKAKAKELRVRGIRH